MSDAIAGNSDITNARSRMKRRLTVLLVLSALIVMTAIATLPFFVIGEDQKVGCCGGEMPVTHDSWMHFNQMRAFHRGKTLRNRSKHLIRPRLLARAIVRR